MRERAECQIDLLRGSYEGSKSTYLDIGVKEPDFNPILIEQTSGKGTPREDPVTYDEIARISHQSPPSSTELKHPNSHLYIVDSLSILFKTHTSAVVNQHYHVEQRNLDEVGPEFLP
jgi:hypothetical protein